MKNRAQSSADPADVLVARYKQLLRDMLDRRPSGTRQKIARALGKHKSFVSQITNPAYPTPLPAKHIGTIFEICHCAQEERRVFIKAYAMAHPRRALSIARDGERPRGGAAATDPATISIELPHLGDPEREAELAETITQFASELIALARKWQ